MVVEYSNLYKMTLPPPKSERAETFLRWNLFAPLSIPLFLLLLLPLLHLHLLHCLF